MPRLTITTIPRSSLIRGFTQEGGSVQTQQWGGKVLQKRWVGKYRLNADWLTPHWTPLHPCPSHTTAAFSSSACSWESPLLSSVFFSSCPIIPCTSLLPFLKKPPLTLRGGKGVALAGKARIPSRQQRERGTAACFLPQSEALGLGWGAGSKLFSCCVGEFWSTCNLLMWPLQFESSGTPHGLECFALLTRERRIDL
uniref:Uncharacterized protein n=1 Tax=Theropithecus gelada TaxID=9565 RepID=A0A8D2E785_THEGE